MLTLKRLIFHFQTGEEMLVRYPRIGHVRTLNPEAPPTRFGGRWTGTKIYLKMILLLQVQARYCTYLSFSGRGGYAGTISPHSRAHQFAHFHSRVALLHRQSAHAGKAFKFLLGSPCFTKVINTFICSGLIVVELKVIKYLRNHRFSKKPLKKFDSTLKRFLE